MIFCHETNVTNLLKGFQISSPIKIMDLNKKAIPGVVYS